MTYPQLFDKLSVKQLQERLNLDVLQFQLTDGEIRIITPPKSDEWGHQSELCQVKP